MYELAPDMIYFISIQLVHFVGLKKKEYKVMHGMNNTKCINII